MLNGWEVITNWEGFQVRQDSQGDNKGSGQGWCAALFQSMLKWSLRRLEAPDAPCPQAAGGEVLQALRRVAEELQTTRQAPRPEKDTPLHDPAEVRGEDPAGAAG